MTMAGVAGIEVPIHGLLPAIDSSRVYFIRRFDRLGRSDKRHVEDFAQLLPVTRDAKYHTSLEQVAGVIEQHGTFPALEKPKLARRLLFYFLTGTEKRVSLCKARSPSPVEGFRIPYCHK